MLKVSIITVCYNSSNTIEATIKSVLSQKKTNIEYIIIDGKSTDNTLEIINKYTSENIKVVSEKDNGIYFAINKGIQIASGDIIGILHADDFYVNDGVINNVVNTFMKYNVDTVYGDLQYVDRLNINKVKRNWISGEYKDGLFLKGWMPPHPAFFVTARCYKKFGIYNTEFTSAADYELMLRLLHKYKCTTKYIPEVLVKMRVGGKSNASFKNRLIANKEDKMAWKINGLKPRLFTILRKPLSKIKQFI